MSIRDDFILKDIHEGYLVGGSVRDFFLGKEFKDRDIAIKNAELFAKNLANNLNATFIVLDNENKIYRLVLRDKENYIDISELRADTIENDLRLRDFTINAIAYDLKNDNFIDITGGIVDIKNRKIRSIREENFSDDPLRILRAFRFMSTLDFNFDDELYNTLTKYLPLINKPAKERIHDEILKLFGGRKTAKTLIEMYKIGVLTLLFPFVKEMEIIPPNSHHHLDLIHHVIETVRQIELLYEQANSDIYEHLSKIDFGGYPRINHLKLAGFFHDIGKYSTWTIEDGNNCIWEVKEGTNYPKGNFRHRFIKHDSIGAKLAINYLKELKFSNKQIDYISEMIKQHIYPSNVVSSPNLDNKIMMRYIRKMGDNVIDNIILAKADRLSAQGPDITAEMTANNLKGLDKLINFYIEIKPTLEPIPKLIDGVEIMNLLNIKQSPLLGQIITELHEAQLNGDVLSKEEALKFLKKYIN